MNKKAWTKLGFLAGGGLFLLACSVAATPAPGQVTPESKLSTPVPKASPGWQNILGEATKEGSVSIYALWRPGTRTALVEAFKDKFGISLEFTPFGRGAEMVARIQAEQRAGLHAADVFGAGGTTVIATMKPAGLLGAVQPFLVLPEATDPKAWRGASLPFLDKDKLAFGMIANMERNVMYNTELVRKGEITTYKDLLKPQYKGKITLSDPAVAGTGNSFMTHLAYGVWNPEEAKEFLRLLLKDQDVVIQRDNRLHVESVARGKFAIGLAPDLTSLVEFAKLGAPVDAVILKEGTLVTPASGVISLPPKSPHPNATRVFVNWLLSKEGQTVFATSWGVPSLRLDVSTEGFMAIALPQPEEKLILQTEEMILSQARMQDIARETIEQALRDKR